jgi:hypothetical protein
MDITSLIIEAVSGAVGGNVAGAAMKENSLGTAGNSIAGILGGGLGGTILHSVMGTAAAGGGGMDLQSILANVGGGGVGGAILMASSASSRTRWLRSSEADGSGRRLERTLIELLAQGRAGFSALRPRLFLSRCGLGGNGDR